MAYCENTNNFLQAKLRPGRFSGLIYFHINLQISVDWRNSKDRFNTLHRFECSKQTFHCHHSLPSLTCPLHFLKYNKQEMEGTKAFIGGKNQLALECRGVCHGWKVCLFYGLKWRENALYKTIRGTWISRVHPLLENSFALISSQQHFWSCSSSPSPAGCLSAKAMCLFLLIPFNLLFFCCSLIYTPHINYTDKPVLPALKAERKEEH